MRLSRRRLFALAAAGAGLPSWPGLAQAETYPSRPVHLIVDLPAGLAPDVLARLVAPQLAERLSQDFVVENKPGAGGNIGADYVIHSAPDGYTLLVMISGNAANAALYPNLGFNFVRDIAPVAFLGYTPFVVVVHPSIPVKTLPDIGIVQETLQLLAGERPRLRPALIPVEVGDRVPLMADRHRVHTWPELVLAGRGPAIPAIAEVLAEQPQIRLVAPDRRRSQTLLRHQRLRPLIHVRRNPAPRVLVGELQEPADQPLPRRYRVLPQPARRLLSPPAAQHPLEHRVLRPQLHHPGHQLQMRRTSQVTSPQPALQPQK